jgi:hypothetical protein
VLPELNALFRKSSLRTTAEDDPFLSKFELHLTKDPTSFSSTLLNGQFGVELVFRIQSAEKNKAPKILELNDALLFERATSTPLEWVLDSDCFDLYNQIFSYLISLKKIQMKLQRTWVIQKQKQKIPRGAQHGNVPRSDVDVLRFVWALRSMMTLWIDGLVGYVQVRQRFSARQRCCFFIGPSFRRRWM